MLDALNERLTVEGGDPMAFDSDCREGICGTCGLVINGIAQGPKALITTCQLHMRSFTDNDVIDVEPWRAQPFPILNDLVVDRRVRPNHPGRGLHQPPTGAAPDAHAIPGAEEAGRRPPSTPRPASAAEPASRHAPTARRRCSWPPKSPPWACCPRASPNATPARWP
jgi:hypothetical protein